MKKIRMFHQEQIYVKPTFKRGMTLGQIIRESMIHGVTADLSLVNVGSDSDLDADDFTVDPLCDPRSDRFDRINHVQMLMTNNMIVDQSAVDKVSSQPDVLPTQSSSEPPSAVVNE